MLVKSQRIIKQLCGMTFIKSLVSTIPKSIPGKAKVLMQIHDRRPSIKNNLICSSADWLVPLASHSITKFF